MLENFSHNVTIFRKKPEIWYSIKDGNWSDPNIWSSAGRTSRNRIPMAIDTVVIATNVTVNQNVTIDKVLGQTGSVVFDNTARTLTVNNDFYYSGGLNMATANSGHSLELRGVNNFIEPSTFVTGTGSTITYARNGNQDVLALSYNSLRVLGTGIKKLTSDLVIPASFEMTVAVTLSLNSYNLTLNSFYAARGAINGVGNLFLNVDAFNINTNPTINITGDVHIQKSFGATGSVFSITCNNIYLYNNVNVVFSTTSYANIIVKADSTANNTGVFQYGRDVYTGVLNGENAGSIFVNKNTSEIGLNYQSATAPMLTGQLQCNNAANTFKYNRLGNQDVKGGTYRTLEFGGSGVKKLLGNVVVNTTAGGSQSTTGTAIIDLNGFTITTI